MKIRKKILFIASVIILYAGSVNAHPFYVSICQVDFNAQNNALEISLKIFADDLILGLENHGASRLYLGEEKENPQTDDYIQSYLNESLKFTINQKSENYTFIGKEMEDDVVWIYLEINNIKNINIISVNCSLLTEVLETQSNIIQINNGSGIKSLLLNKRKQSDSITF